MLSFPSTAGYPGQPVERIVQERTQYRTVTSRPQNSFLRPGAPLAPAIDGMLLPACHDREPALHNGRSRTASTMAAVLADMVDLARRSLHGPARWVLISLTGRFART